MNRLVYMIFSNRWKPVENPDGTLRVYLREKDARFHCEQHNWGVVRKDKTIRYAPVHVNIAIMAKHDIDDQGHGEPRRRAPYIGPFGDLHIEDVEG